jgi:hypothetical protein
MPQLLADARPTRRPGLFTAGSPVRFVAPIAPAAIGATSVPLVPSSQAEDNRRLILGTTASTGAAVALSVFLIRKANIALLNDREPLSAGQRRRLATTWHLANAPTDTSGDRDVRFVLPHTLGG